MKKTITINLGGRAFLITEEAYNSLNDYLSSIETAFSGHDSADEIVADIESRISELCEKRLTQSNCEIIELTLVNEMINRMGKPEAMMPDEEEQADENNRTTRGKNSDNSNENVKNILEGINLNKKYYLDTEDRMVGGVISGLAAYIKVDVTILRLIALVAIIATGLIGIIVYFIAWCICPTAGNTTEKLRMQGIEPTPENIAEKITTEKSPADKSSNTISDKEKSNMTRLFMLAAIAVVAIYIYMNTQFNICINNNVINGTIVISLILLILYLVQKMNVNHTLKTIMLVLLFALILLTMFAIIFVTIK